MDINEKDRRRYWSAHYRKLSKKGSCIAGRRILVKKITGEDLGYTSGGDKKAAIVCLNHSHEIVPKALADATMFIDGVFCHEIGHQLFTDFEAWNAFQNALRTGSNLIVKNWFIDAGISDEKLKSYNVDISMKKPFSIQEVNVFHEIANIIEDTSIEYWLFNTIDGILLDSLKYTICTMYKKSARLEESETPFQQLIGALINYGDIGLLHGNFTFPEARKAFLEVQPIYDKAIEDPNSRRRIAIVYIVFLKLRHLWEQDMKESEKLMKFLDELMKGMPQNGTSEGSGIFSENASDAGFGGKSDETEKGEETRKRRKTLTIRKLIMEDNKTEDEAGSETSEQEVISDPEDISQIDSEEIGDFDENLATSKPNSESDEKEDSLESDICDKKSEDEKNSEETDDTDYGDNDNSSKAGDSSPEKDDTEENSSDSSKDGSDNAKEEPTSNNDDKNSEEGSEDNTNNDSKSSPLNDSSDSDTPSETPPEHYGDDEDIEDELERENEDFWEESSLSEEDIDEIYHRINDEIEEDKIEALREENKEAPPEFDIKGRGFHKATCENIVVAVDDPDEISDIYDITVEPMNMNIRRLAGQLKRASEKPNTVKTRKSSGVLNIERYSKMNACPTTKLFDKRRTPNENDLAVFVNVDESGSMSWGKKDTMAKLAAIAISEACAQAGIPLYIMGFTADNGYQANHRHYVRWKNTKTERLSLLDVHARANNFDGYSIRYAANILKKRQERHKLLIVISDGEPACRAYASTSTGIADTKEAIRQATSEGIVVHGIAIGCDSPEILKDMYGVNFTENSNLDLLFKDFGNAILKQLRKDW